jgi:hypothetical protein
MKLTTHLHPVQKIWMSEAVPLTLQYIFSYICSNTVMYTINEYQQTWWRLGLLSFRCLNCLSIRGWLNLLRNARTDRPGMYVCVSVCVCTHTYTLVHNNISSNKYPHMNINRQDCDPCTWQIRPPVRVDAPQKTIPKFSSKLKYGHESQLGARGQDGQIGWLIVSNNMTWPEYQSRRGMPKARKVKVKCLTKHHAMKVYWGGEV